MLDCGRFIITSCCQGRPRRLQALFGNLSRLFRLNVVPACSASLVLGLRPRLEMNSPFWRRPCRSDTRLTRHLLQPPSPALETLFPSSRSVQNLAFVVSISFPGWSRSLSPFDSSSSPLANPTIIAFATFTTVQRRALGALLLSIPTSVTPSFLGCNVELLKP